VSPHAPTLDAETAQAQYRCVKANRLKWFLLLLFTSAVFSLTAQHTEADRNLQG